MALVNTKDQFLKAKCKTSAAWCHEGKVRWGQGICSAFAAQRGDSELPPARSDELMVAPSSPGQVAYAISRISMA